jgi:DNA helicase-2/ATP-dependent DNA helicase PcrA
MARDGVKHSKILENVRILSFKKLIEIYDKNWIDEWYESEEQKKEYYERGKKSLRKFYESFLKKKLEVVLIDNKPALEINFNFKIGKYFLKGKIDRIDKTSKPEIGSPPAAAGGEPISGQLPVEIIDYKTGERKEKLRPEDKMQLLIYQMAAEKVFGLKPLKLSYYYLEEGEKISFLGGPEDIVKEKEKIISKIEEIKKSDFKASPGRHCQRCDFNKICQFSQW